ncbi:MAG: DegV family protein [Chloroflexi bacterium]|nr:DegV family protein [Chloroflexota bacterium]
MTVQVVTDSTSDLPPALARELGIQVVPLQVHFGGETYRDGVDIQPAEFFQKLRGSPVLPTTSQPSAGDFLETYRKITATGADILSIHISSKLSGTHNSAMLAKQELGGRIEVLDSQQASFALGLIAVAAARAARAGASLEEATRVARQAMPRTYFFGLVDTLEYLQKGGRIGKAQALLGGLLKVKPILTIREGEAHDLARVRTRAKAIDRMVEIVASLRPVVELAVVHSSPEDEVAALTDRVKQFSPGKVVQRTMFGPVIGTYIGPGGLGVVLQVAEK